MENYHGTIARSELAQCRLDSPSMLHGKLPRLNHRRQG